MHDHCRTFIFQLIALLQPSYPAFGKNKCDTLACFLTKALDT